jgi:hypothetical protein
MATEARPRAFHFGALVYPVSIVSVAMVSAEYQTQQRGVFTGVVDLRAGLGCLLWSTTKRLMAGRCRLDYGRALTTQVAAFNATAA